jgi:vacuolar-type H+-ATPase subunit H
MSKKTETNESYSYNNTNNQNNNNFNNNVQDFKESVNRSLDEAKDNIKRSIDESKNQIPRYNNIVNSYQEQSLQTAREISEEFIDAQKEIIGSLQSAWRPINENYSSMVTSFASPDSIAKAYTRFVSNVADNTVSAIRLTNNVIFSNLDSMKSVLQQAKDNSKHISKMGVNTAKTFEQNSRQLTSAAKDEAAHTNVIVSTPTSSTAYSSTTKKQ